MTYQYVPLPMKTFFSDHLQGNKHLLILDHPYLAVTKVDNLFYGDKYQGNNILDHIMQFLKMRNFFSETNFKNDKFCLALFGHLILEFGNFWK